jgi:hypothetical protein
LFRHSAGIFAPVAGIFAPVAGILSAMGRPGLSHGIIPPDRTGPMSHDGSVPNQVSPINSSHGYTQHSSQLVTACRRRSSAGSCREPTAIAAFGCRILGCRILGCQP